MKIETNTQHFTPPDMAHELARRTIQPLLSRGLLPCDIRVFDPACGNGNLLLAAEEYLAGESVNRGYDKEQHDTARRAPYDSLENARVNVALGSLYGGCEIDELVADAAQRRIEDSIQRRYEFDHVMCGDALFLAQSDFKDMFGPLLPNVILLNPPFIAGGRVSTLFGQAYRKKLKERFPARTREYEGTTVRFPGWGGRADIASCFLLLADEIVSGGDDGPPGPQAIGVIATNTIAQGDTREAGLMDLIFDRGWRVHSCSDDLKWPGRANVSVKMFVLTRHVRCENTDSLIDQSWLRIPRSRHF